MSNDGRLKAIEEKLLGESDTIEDTRWLISRVKALTETLMAAVNMLPNKSTLQIKLLKALNEEDL
jgi:hypothetical protein